MAGVAAGVPVQYWMTDGGGMLDYFTQARPRGAAARPACTHAWPVHSCAQALRGAVRAARRGYSPTVHA